MALMVVWINLTRASIIITARCYAERGYEIACRHSSVCLIVCPSVWPSVTFRYRDHIGWNSSKIISKPIRLLTPTWAIRCNGNTPPIRMEWIWVGSGAHKSCKISDQGYLLLWTNRKSHTCSKSKSVEDRAALPLEHTTFRKSFIGNQIVTWLMTSHDLKVNVGQLKCQTWKCGTRNTGLGFWNMKKTYARTLSQISIAVSGEIVVVVRP